jgi:hypothetical protein
MLQFQLKKAILRGFAFMFLSLAAFTFTAKAGGDIFQVYLNNKLILKQFVIEPLTLKNLPLQDARATDELIVHYSHCGAIGKGRSIVIKDEKGKIYKEWKFDDATGTNTGMKIPVKEILELQKKNSGAELNLYYASQEIPKGRMLASLLSGKKGTT